LAKNSITFLASAALTLSGALCSAGVPADAADVVSTWQGVYTKEQAERGKSRYFTSCASCHGGLLQGDGDTPELAGKLFMKRWEDQSIAALFTFASSQMPIGRPGSLGAQGYAEVIAYILASNGFPDGARELPASQAALEGIIIEPNK
jgi:S-disulfanyl-L-cysteine oxidoreductase SoxD